MDRGTLGTLTLPTDRDDDSYLDFVASLRVFDRSLSGLVQQRGNAAIGDRAIPDIDTLRATLDPVPLLATRNRIWRSAQEMMWDTIQATYRKRASDLLADLDRADSSGPGSVSWNPAFEQPEYARDVAFHIQPGSYHADPLAGYVYHLGTKVLLAAHDDQDEGHRRIVGIVPEPLGGVRRVLDVGCAIGQATTAFKERFPDAEIWGIDSAAPMIRYAHKRAIDLGISVHFAQRLAEETGFPAASFDLCYVNILFHETPPAVTEVIVGELFRVLRPGGLLVVVDAANRPFGGRGLVHEYLRDFVVRSNGEPYELEWAHADFAGMLRRAGFASIDEAYQPARPILSAALPMRVAVRP